MKLLKNIMNNGRKQRVHYERSEYNKQIMFCKKLIVNKNLSQLNCLYDQSNKCMFSIIHCPLLSLVTRPHPHHLSIPGSIEKIVMILSGLPS